MKLCDEINSLLGNVDEVKSKVELRKGIRFLQKANDNLDKLSGNILLETRKIRQMLKDILEGYEEELNMRFFLASGD